MTSESSEETRNGVEWSSSSGSNVWVPLNERERLSPIHILGICGAMISFQIAFTIEFSLANPIMSTLGIPTWSQTLIWICGPLSGFVVHPIVGFYSDIARFKLGRRRPFILMGFSGMIVGLALMYFVVDLGNAMGSNDTARKIGKITWFVISFVITNISINLIQGPSRMLLGDLVPLKQQNFANSMAAMVLGLATVLTNLIGGLNLAKRMGLEKFQIYTEQLTFIAGGFFIIVSVIITMFLAKEEQQKDAQVQAKNPFKEIFNAVKVMPKPVWRIGILFMLSWTAYMPFQIELTDFFGVVVFQGNPTVPNDAKYRDGLNFGMLTMALVNGLVILVSPLQGPLLRFMGIKWLYAVSQIIEVIVLVSVFFLTNKWILFGLFSLMGFACQMFNSIPYAIVGMSVQTEQLGVYMGVLNWFVVIGQQISNFLIGTGIGAVVGDKKGYIIGSGSVFALVSACYCYFIIVPKKDGDSKEHFEDQTCKEALRRDSNRCSA